MMSIRWAVVYSSNDFRELKFVVISMTVWLLPTIPKDCFISIKRYFLGVAEPSLMPTTAKSYCELGDITEVNY